MERWRSSQQEDPRNPRRPSSTKYGGGPVGYRDLLSQHSNAIRALETLEISSLIEISLEKAGYPRGGVPVAGRLEQLNEQYDKLLEAKDDLMKTLDRLIAEASKS